MTRRGLLCGCGALVVYAALGATAACGRRAPPRAPEDVEDTWGERQTYPTPQDFDAESP